MEIKSITNGSYPSEGFLSFCFSVPQTVFLCVTTRNTSANGQTTKTLKKEIEQSSFENKAKGGMWSEEFEREKVGLEMSVIRGASSSRPRFRCSW